MWGTRLAVAFWIVLAVVNLTNAAVQASQGDFFWLGFASVGAVCSGINIHLNLKEYRDGRDRQAQASAQDSSSGIGSAYAKYADAPATGGPVPSLNKQDLEIEQVQSDMPILAHRIAGLRFDGTDKWFAPLNHGGPFGVDATASCESGLGYRSFLYEPRPSHQAPGLGCSCGYYALPSDIEPWSEGTNFVTLMVELSGTVIEHEGGYRAEHQRVVECQIPACAYCRRPSEAIWVEKEQMVSTSCWAHVPKVHPAGMVFVGTDDLRSTLPVPVSLQGRTGDAGASSVPIAEVGQ